MQLENQFSVTRIKLDTFDYPKVEVHTWSNVFEPGGHVSVEANTPEGSRITLHRQNIEENRDVSDERAYAQELADEWNADCETNWRAEILRCLKLVAQYEQDQIDKLQEHIDALAKYNADIERLRGAPPKKEKQEI